MKKSLTHNLSAVVLVSVSGAALTACSGEVPIAGEEEVGTARQALGKTTEIISSDGPQIDDLHKGNIGPLPVGPPPNGQGPSPSDPADYGLCGLVALGGVWDQYATARIRVGANGYYEYDVEQGTFAPPGSVRAQFTCIRLSEFKNLPPASTAYSKPLEVLSASSWSVVKQPLGEICVWAGARGALSAVDSFGTDEEVFAQFDVTQPYHQVVTGEGIALTSYAWCVNYKPKHAWTTAKEHSTSFPNYPWYSEVPLPTKGADDMWCYMEGIRGPGEYSKLEDGYFFTKIYVDKEPPAYFFSNTNAGQFWNSLAREQ